jgi:photosystem II stability/assembly factor-like uncharacterized protein
LAAIVTLTPLALLGGTSLRKAAPVYVLAIDPQNPATVYAVASVQRPRAAEAADQLYRTDDGGESWRPITNPAMSNFALPLVFAVAVDPKVSSMLYAAAGYEAAGIPHRTFPLGFLFKSEDGGTSWNLIFDGSNVPSTIAIDPLNSETVYFGALAAVEAVGIFKSVDGGAEWSDVSPTPVDACKVLGVDPASPAVIYAGGCDETPVLRSSDAAASWVPASAGLPSEIPLASFAISPSQPATLYAGTLLHGVYRSLDSGGHWIAVTTGIGNTQVNSLAVDPRSASVAYAGTPAGLFKTLSGGASWSPSAPGLENAAIYAVVIDPSAPDTVYLGTSLGVFKSIDAGATSSPIKSGLPPVGIVPVPVEGPPAAVHGRP